jgi:hypothetical protein
MSDPASQPLPEPSFDTLMQIVAAPCLVHLGLAPNPATGTVQKDLDQAKWTIDLLHTLEEKTRGNLTDAEKGQIDQMLHQLRAAYLKERG